MFHPRVLIAVTEWIIDQASSFLSVVPSGRLWVVGAAAAAASAAAAAASAAAAAGMGNRKWTSLTQEWDWRKHDHDEENVKSTSVGNKKIPVSTQEKDELLCPSWIRGIRKVRL